jgi:ABC-type transport system involved in Fe-S cluster assembly fused permease/ATPase subunit
VLFNDTIYYNVAYGRPAATEAEVVAACKAARIHEAILAMPNGSLLFSLFRIRNIS